jgi:hypothetical protein
MAYGGYSSLKKCFNMNKKKEGVFAFGSKIASGGFVHTKAIHT